MRCCRGLAHVYARVIVRKERARLERGSDSGFRLAFEQQDVPVLLGLN